VQLKISLIDSQNVATSIGLDQLPTTYHLGNTGLAVNYSDLGSLWVHIDGFTMTPSGEYPRRCQLRIKYWKPNEI
jgi:hypothetical protein